MTLFVFDDFLKSIHDGKIPEKDLETAGKILSSILEQNPDLLYHLEIRRAPRKILVSVGHGAGWSSWMGGEEAKFAATYQPIIDFLESGGKFTGKTYDYLSTEGYHVWEQFDEPGQSVLKQFVLDLREHLGDPEAEPYLGGADDLRVEVVSSAFQIMDSESGSEYIRTLKNFKNWI